MTQPRRGQLDRITPNPAVNKPPREVPSIALTTDLLSLYFNFIRDLVLAQVGLALGGINIFGVTPFAFLTDWGNKLRSDAAQAFAQGQASLAVAQSSNANSAVAIAEVQQIKGTASDAKDGLLLTWNELWAANTGQTVTTGQQKTVTEVKQSQTTVRQDGQNNTLNIQGTWDNAVQGSLYVTNPNATNQTLAQFKQALFGTSYTANQAEQASGTNTNNIQSTWNSIYEAAGGATGANRTLSEAKTTLNGVTLNAQELIDALLNAIYGTSLTGQSRTNVAPALEERTTEVDEQFASGSNLALSPGFEETNLPRHAISGSAFPTTPAASLTAPTGSYTSAVRRPGGGTRSWTWTSQAGQAGGLYLSPTRLSNVFTVRAGDWYYMEMWVYYTPPSGVGVSGSIQFGPWWQQSSSAGGSTDSRQVIALSTLTANSWNQLSGYFQVPPNRDTAYFSARTTGVPASFVFYADDVMLREVTDAKEAAEAADAAAQDASDALAAVDIDRRAGSNIMLSPDFEDSSIPRLLWGVTAAGTAVYSTTGYPNSAVSGTQGFRWTQGSNATNGLVLSPSATSQYVIVQPGDRFDVEAMIYQAGGSTASGAIRIGVEWSQNSGGSATLRSREYPLTTSLHQVWTKLNFTTPACPANYNTARFFVTVGPTSAGVNAISGRTYTVDDVIVREVTVAQDTADAVNEGLGGTPTPPSGGATPSDIKTLSDDINKAVGELGAAVSELTKESDAAALAGEAFSVNFSTVGDSSNFPASFTATRYTTSGSHGGAQVSGGRLLYVPSAVNAMDNGRSLGMFTSVHGSQYQRVGVTLTSVLPYLVANSRGGNWIFARATSDTNADALPDTGAFARMYYPNLLAGLSNAARLVVGYVSGGVATAATTVDFTYTVGSTYWLEAGNPSSPNVNQYRVLKDGYPLTNWITLPSLTGTRSGLALEVASDGLFRYDPARVAAWVAYDNTPAATLGEGLRAEGGSGLPVSTSATVANFGSGLFTTARSTAGLTWSTINNAATASVAGWYAVNASVYTATTTSATFQLVLAVNETGSLDNGFVNHTWGDPVSGTGAKAATVHGLVYLAAGGSVKVRYLLASASITTAGGADAVRTSFNMAFANNTLPTNP